MPAILLFAVPRKTGPHRQVSPHSEVPESQVDGDDCDAARLRRISCSGHNKRLNKNRERLEVFKDNVPDRDRSPCNKVCRSTHGLNANLDLYDQFDCYRLSIFSIRFNFWIIPWQ